LGQKFGLPVLSPLDEMGRFLPEYGWLAGRSSSEVAHDITEDLRSRGLLVRADTVEHRYPECWRCHTPLIFRVSDDWFIRVDEIREPMRTANLSVTWVPAHVGRRMDDWLVNMGDWNISRRRYYGMPLPFYPCRACGHLHVVGSKAELAELATGPLDGLQELHRPWIDRVKIRCDRCGQEVERVVEVGDVWLDAGIVPFSTLGWQNPEWVAHGLATGAAQGMTTADLADHSYWDEWFPADWISEMREQVRLWFYSQLFMSTALTGQAPFRKVLSYEKMLDERGEEMHGSRGNMVSADDAFERMGADVMRWQYCAQPPSQNLLFGFTRGYEIQRKLLTLWNSVRLLVQYANLTDLSPSLSGPVPDGELDVLDRWMLARTAALVSEATVAFEAYLTADVLRAFESYVDDMSNWYIRRSRRRFWNGDVGALQTLWHALVQSLRVVSPVMPFLTEHLWQVIVADVDDDAPRSVFLAGWPELGAADERLLADMVVVRQVVDLARAARATAGLRVRQPLRRLVVEGADEAASYTDLIADELRVKEVVLRPVDATDIRVRPNLPVLGPLLGPDLPKVRAALEAGEYEVLDDGSFRLGDRVLGPDDVLVERLQKPGWVVLSSDEGITVALDTALDDELRTEARVYDLVHKVNRMRKDAGLEITDRIRLVLPESDEDLRPHADWIMAETLSVDLKVGGDDIALAKADQG
jgi:isoleucyl-tRNA synthetase